MPPSKSKKRAWRRIDASAEEAVLAEVPLPGEGEAPRGRAAGPPAALPDAALFFEDKAAAPSPLPGARRLPASRLRGAAALKAKTTTVDLLIRNPRAGKPGLRGPPPKQNPVISAPRTPSPAALAALAARRAAAAAQAAKDDALGEDEEVRAMLPAPADPWADATAAATAARRARARRLAPHAPPIPALEVDAPGCSFNPDPAQHQDALAVAVAAEVAADLARELAPRPPLLVEDGDGGGGGGGGGVGGMVVVAGPGAEVDDGPSTSGSDDDATPGRTGRRTAERKTQAQRNRAARAAAAAAAAAAAKAARIRADSLKSVNRLAKELEAKEAEAAARAAEKAAVRAEKAATVPPKLGRVNFKPAPVQVALTEDLRGGSLRACRPAAGLLRDRFSSVQKRGLVEPRLPAPKKKGKRATFTAGERTDRAVEAAAEVAQLQKANARARKAHAAAVAAAVAAREEDEWSS